MIAHTFLLRGFDASVVVDKKRPFASLGWIKITVLLWSMDLLVVAMSQPVESKQ